jgi:predicted GNAT family N-acyltransferase
MFQTQWQRGEAAQQALALRRRVFVEGAGIDPQEEFDAFDAAAMHLYVWQESGPIATGRIYPLGAQELHIGHIAVEAAFQAMPFAELVLRVMLDQAQRMPYPKITALLSEAEAPLFLAFGFLPDGEPRFCRKAWRRPYAVKRDAIIWDSPCKHGGA